MSIGFWPLASAQASRAYTKDIRMWRYAAGDMLTSFCNRLFILTFADSGVLLHTG